MENKKKYSKVVEEFDSCFKVQKNVIYEHAHFSKRNQMPTNLEQFIIEVHKLGDSCEFGKMKNT